MKPKPEGEILDVGVTPYKIFQISGIKF